MDSGGWHPGTVLGWCDSDWRGGYQPQLVKVIELAFKNFATSDPLWPFQVRHFEEDLDASLKLLALLGHLETPVVV